MKFLILSITVLLISLTAACSVREDNEPRQICVAMQDAYSPRSGYYKTCAEWGIGCLKPLILDELGDKLICRLRKPGE